MYTRVVVDADLDAENTSPQNYDNERRTALARLLSNQGISYTVSLDVELGSPDLKTPVSLFSVGHTSDHGKGESFTTDLNSSNISTPLFRIGPSTEVTFHAHVDTSKSNQFDATPLILKAVQTAVSLAAPPAGILTTLSKVDLSKRAQAIDSALSGLSSREIVEDNAIGREIWSWNGNSEIVVSAFAPSWSSKTDIYNAHQPTDVPIKQWRVTLECPRASVFNPTDLCSHSQSGQTFKPDSLKEIQQKVALSTPPALILETEMAASVSLKDHVASLKFYTDFLQFDDSEKTPVKAVKVQQPTATTASKATLQGATLSFCSDLLNDLYGQGLNHFDASLGVRAVSFAMPGLAGTSKADAISKFCPALIADEVAIVKTSKSGDKDVWEFILPLPGSEEVEAPVT